MAKGFNKEMDKYLGGRKNKKLDRFPKRKKVTFAEGVEVEEESRPSFWSRYFGPKKQIPQDELTEEERVRLSEMEEEIEAIDDAEQNADPEDVEVLEEARESALSRFFEKLRFFRARHELEDKAEQIDEAAEELQQQELEMEEDVKEALKISTKWLGKLTKRNREEFMGSDDYKKYKKILRKYKVAK